LSSVIRNTHKKSMDIEDSAVRECLETTHLYFCRLLFDCDTDVIVGSWNREKL